MMMIPMINETTILTIVGTVLAKEGTDFIYEGPQEACESCKVAKVCHNTKLRAGRRYTVVTVRPTTHSCAVHPDGATAVEVVDADIPMFLPKDEAKRRSRMEFQQFCNEESCKYYTMCNPTGIEPGHQYIVKEVEDIEENLPCGRSDLKKATITSLPV